MTGTDEDVSEGIKKQVQRFRRKHQYAYSHIVNMARRQFGDLKHEYISGDGITDSDLENVNPTVAPIGYSGYKNRQARRSEGSASFGPHFAFRMNTRSKPPP